jgi:hypothetical protein
MKNTFSLTELRRGAFPRKLGRGEGVTAEESGFLLDAPIPRPEYPVKRQGEERKKGVRREGKPFPEVQD